MNPRVKTLKDGPPLPSPTMLDVVVNGVTVQMYDDSKPSNLAPMRVPLDWLAAEDNAEQERVTKLMEAGVLSVPLYRSDADAAGIQYENLETYMGLSTPDPS